MEAALITALASVVILIMNIVFGERFKRNQKAWEIDLARCDEQIGKLYAPLENLVEQLDATDDVKRKMVDQDPGHAKEISKFCYDNYFAPIHEKIRVLLDSHLHLLEDKGIPPDFIEYYKHVASERVFFSLSANMEQAKAQGLIPETAKDLSFDTHPYPENVDLTKPNFKRVIKIGASKVQERQEEILQRFRRMPAFWRIKISN